MTSLCNPPPFVIACLLLASWVRADPAIQLSNARLKVLLSSASGKIESLSDGKGNNIVAGNEDRYDLDGKASTEASDEVLSSKSDRRVATLECVNRPLGLRMTKDYTLRENVLEKEVRYLTDHPDRLLLKVSSETSIETALFREGDYYVPTDDGYKVYVSPFMAGPSVKEPVPWTVSTGSFVFYFPRQDRTLVHYRYRVNGQYFYSEAHSALESKFVPGGAITALAAGFIDDHSPLTLSSHFALIDGDPRDYHKHLLNQPPYTDYSNRKAPDWFNKSRMFLSDIGATGMKLITDRETVGRDVISFLKLLKDGEYLMVFFNHWTTAGDFPYKGTFRYYTYTEAGYSQPVPVETLKENIRWLKSLSPRIRVGGYAMFIPTAGTYPYEQHKEWLVYNKDGVVEFAGDGIALGAVPDFSSGYRDYLLDQMRHYVTDLGFDWIHIDCGPFEAINWNTKQVVQSGETARYYDELGQIFESNGAAIVENVAPMVGLWAHGGYMECQQPDRWEKKDWRILAVPGYLAALYRSRRPGSWVNLCYGTSGMYGLRNAETGMKGWIRNALTWWRDVAHSLAHEKVVDELLETRVSDVRVSPSWWKLEIDRRLEAEALEKGPALIIPVLLHGDKASEEQITVAPATPSAEVGRRQLGKGLASLPSSLAAGLAKDRYLFTFDMRLSSPTPLDVFKPVPWKSDYLELTGFSVEKVSGGKHSHRMRLDPLRNYYHLMSQVPAWVYTYEGGRTSLLLPENHGVKISGSLPLRAQSYGLKVVNDNHAAQILAYLPAEWTGVVLEVNGKPVNPILTPVQNKSFLLINLKAGKSEILVSESKTPNLSKLTRGVYSNPSTEVWRETAERLFYSNLDHRAYEENGRSCLSLKEISPGTGGTVEFHIVSKEQAGGFALKLKGENTGGRIAVVLSAGDAWTYEIIDDFSGWKDFEVRNDQMTPGTTRRRWEETTYMTLRLYPANGREMSLADLRLLPAAEGQFAAHKVAKRRVSAVRTSIPPSIDGFGNDGCWKNCETATDFNKYGTEELSESKTHVKVCYDADNLYVLFDNLEPITKLAETRVPESQVWLTDHAHLFVDPFKDKVHYYEIGVDTAGTIADIKNSDTGGDMKWNGEYEVKTGLNWNVGWMAELRVPFKTLGKIPKEGEVWGITFARVDIDKEFSVWTGGEWNDPSLFGELLFSGEVR